MTTSRIVRGTKARIFFYISATLIIIALIACYNNTLTQLEDIRKSNEICHQQEENLSIQLQVITDYKQRLEKSLKTEKAEHQQTKTYLENKLNDERTKNEKSSNDLNLRFTSLQQHFNILQTQHDDFKEECSNTQNKQLNEINDLQAKLKEIQEELKKIESTKERLKTQYLQLQSEKEQLERQLKTYSNTNSDSESRINHLTKVNHELQQELDQFKVKCPTFESLPIPALPLSLSSIAPHNVALSLPQSLSSKKSDVVLAMPKTSNITTNTTRSTTAASNRDRFNHVQPIGIPSVTPKSAKYNQINKDDTQQPPQSPPMLSNTDDNNNNNDKKIPEGVVPAPVFDNPVKTDNNNNNNNNNGHNENEDIDLENEPINSRYRNKIDSEMKNENDNNDNDKKNNNKSKRNDDVGVLIDDNAANEIAEDTFNVDNKNHQHIDAVGGDGNKLYDDHQMEIEDDGTFV